MSTITVRKYDPNWGSHIPVLIKVFEISDGPVLELGMGIFSTPLLHTLCLSKNRPLFSYDDNQYYVEQHGAFVNDLHKINFVNNWDDIKIDDTKWGVVLIDHGPGVRRSVDAIRLANAAQYIVLHDSDPRENRHYGYPNAYPHFKYRFDYTKTVPNTTVLSNFVDLSDFKI